MTPAPRKRRFVAFAVVVSGLGIVLAYLSLRDTHPALGATLSLVPPAALAISALRRSARGPRLWIGIAAIAAVLVAGFEVAKRHYAGVFLVDHAGVNLALAFAFGRTLTAGREPLCTRFARLIHGTLPPEVARYTRGVTVAWTAFFLAVVALSLALYFGGYHEAWSVLATIASPVLLGIMFLAEYAVRLRMLPNWERIGILGGIRAFSRHFAAARAQAPR